MNDLAAQTYAAWCRWISGRHLSIEVLRTLAAWYQHDECRPFAIDGFLEADRALALSRRLQSLAGWAPTLAVLGQKGEVIDVDEATWQSTPQHRRWSSQDILPLSEQTLDPVEDDPVVDFLDFFVAGDAFKTWLSCFIGFALDDRVSCELARYKPDDHIIFHEDTHDSRVVGVNFYLDPSWRAGMGGELAYRNQAGEEHEIEPRFGTMCLMPIRRQCAHRVAVWRHHEIGRYTISLSYRTFGAE